MSTFTYLFVRTCSISSLTVMSSVLSSFVHFLQFLQFTQQYVILLAALSTKLNAFSHYITPQQTFVLMKTSSRRLIKTDMFPLALRLQKTSPRRLGQEQYIRLGHMSSRSLQDVFKTFSRRLQDVFKTSCQDVFKTSSKRLQGIFKTFWRRLQDFFKTSSRRLAKIPSRCFQGVPSS